jgi:Domain of unknown function (DUF4296)
MMKAFLISFLVLVIFSCTSKEKIPRDILPQEQMQAVIWDLLRADEFVNSYIRNDSTKNRKDETTRLYEEVYRIHKTNRDQFKQSLHFYNSHPELLKPVFDSLENKKTTELDIRKRPSLVDSSRRKMLLRDSLHKRALHDTAHGKKPLHFDSVPANSLKRAAWQKRQILRDSINRKLLTPRPKP